MKTLNRGELPPATAVAAPPDTVLHTIRVGGLQRDGGGADQSTNDQQVYIDRHVIERTAAGHQIAQSTGRRASHILVATGARRGLAPPDLRSPSDPLRDMLEDVDPDDLSPREALDRRYRLKKLEN